MDFTKETTIDRETYDSLLRRIHYDDRDIVMYENMLNFLWEYIIAPIDTDTKEELLEEYTHWNMQMIDKCYYHIPQDVPYAGIRLAYQSIVDLLSGNYEEGMVHLARMGEDAFSSDGKAPKLFLSGKGQRFEPMSRLFLLYNYAKVFDRVNPELLAELKRRYPFAFTVFNDGAHEEHDRFYEEQMDLYRDVIFYPVFERVYKQPWGPKEFYVYFDRNRAISIEDMIKSER